MSNRTPRPAEPRRWRTLLLAGAAVSTALAGLQPADTALAADSGQARLWLAAGEGGEGGEGGESGTVASVDEGVLLLTDFGLIEGHLRAAVALHREGRHEMAATHSKHPADEIYTGLAERLSDRGLEGFSQELAVLADALAAMSPTETVDAAFGEILTRLNTLRAALNEPPREVLESVEHLVRKAAEEYSVGVKDGQIADIHEYQDAWGFLQVARDQVLVLQGSDDPGVVKAADAALVALDEAGESFAGIAPESSLPGDSAAIFAAAARIEFAALALD